jgi:hypothetical protein
MRGGRFLLLGPLEIANLNYWTCISHLKTETDPLSETLCSFFIFLEYQTMDNAQNPINAEFVSCHKHVYLVGPKYIIKSY